jgi:hypothetical protein
MGVRCCGSEEGERWGTTITIIRMSIRMRRRDTLSERGRPPHRIPMRRSLFMRS